MLKRRVVLRALAAMAIVLTVNCGRDGGFHSPLEPQFATVKAGGKTYTRIEESAPAADLSLSQVIGIDGGSVSLAGHRITVPAGAVSVPTIFTLTLANNGYVEVELTAVVSTLLGVVDVGEDGFNKPVSLALTYARGTNVTDPARLKIIRLKSNGKHEILPSTVQSGPLTVTAELDHFSRYAMVSD